MDWISQRALCSNSRLFSNGHLGLQRSLARNDSCRINHLIIAELLHAEGARAESRTLENFGNPYASISKLLYARPSIRPYANAWKTKRGAPFPQLHLWLWASTRVMFNWQLSQQATRWPITRDHIAGSSQLIFLGEKEGVRAKAKLQCKLTPGALLTYLLTYFFHSRLFPWYIAYVISTILVTLTGYGLLKFNWKNYKPHAEQLYAHNLSLVFCFWSKKNNSLFPYWSDIESRSSAFTLG